MALKIADTKTEMEQTLGRDEGDWDGFLGAIFCLTHSNHDKIFLTNSLYNNINSLSLTFSRRSTDPAIV